MKGFWLAAARLLALPGLLGGVASALLLWGPKVRVPDLLVFGLLQMIVYAMFFGPFFLAGSVVAAIVGTAVRSRSVSRQVVIETWVAVALAGGGIVLTFHTIKKAWGG